MEKIVVARKINFIASTPKINEAIVNSEGKAEKNHYNWLEVTDKNMIFVINAIATIQTELINIQNQIHTSKKDKL